MVLTAHTLWLFIKIGSLLSAYYYSYMYIPLWENKNVIFVKQAAISQMEKDLNQRTQDAKERDKEVCSLEYATVTAIPSTICFVILIRGVCCCFYTIKISSEHFLADYKILGN